MMHYPDHGFYRNYVDSKLVSSLFLLSVGRWSFCCSSQQFRGTEVVMFSILTLKGLGFSKSGMTEGRSGIQPYPATQCNLKDDGDYNLVVLHY